MPWASRLTHGGCGPAQRLVRSPRYRAVWSDENRRTFAADSSTCWSTIVLDLRFVRLSNPTRVPAVEMHGGKRMAGISEWLRQYLYQTVNVARELVRDRRGAQRGACGPPGVAPRRHSRRASMTEGGMVRRRVIAPFPTEIDSAALRAAITPRRHFGWTPSSDHRLRQEACARESERFARPRRNSRQGGGTDATALQRAKPIWPKRRGWAEATPGSWAFIPAAGNQLLVRGIYAWTGFVPQGRSAAL